MIKDNQLIIQRPKISSKYKMRREDIFAPRTYDYIFEDGERLPQLSWISSLMYTAVGIMIIYLLVFLFGR